MKLRKIMSVFLAALMLIIPLNLTELKASAQEYSGSNLNAHNYFYKTPSNRYNWANPTLSYLTEANGGFMRVQAGAVNGKVVVQYYDSSFKFKSEKLVSYGLPLFGAFYETESNYYLLSGQNNPNEDDSVEVYRVTKFDKSWNSLGSVGLYGENTYMPFDGGSARMTHQGKFLVVRTCHEMYTSDDGNHHQANVTFEINTSTMKVTDKLTDVRSNNFGYVSHSFNQFVKIDNNNIVGVDHGDAYPRSVVLIKYPSDMSYGQFYTNIQWNSFCTAIDMLPISGSTGDNVTGVEVGGFEISSSSYIVAGNSIDQSRFGSNNLPKNIFISTIDRELKNTPTITYLTDYDDTAASNPYLVKVNDNKFFVIWEHNGNICYRQIDGSGKLVGKQKDFVGQLSDCQPIVSGDRVVWYVWNDSVSFWELSVDSLPTLTGVKASTGNSYANLSWSKNSSAAYYKVSVNKGGTYTELGQTKNLSYKASSLAANTSYSFRVTAYNSSNEAIAVGNITAKTKAKLSSLKATTTRNTAALTWGKNSSASYYNIYVLKDGKYEKLAKTTKLTYTASSLAANTSYTFRVTAYDSSNNILAYSIVTAKTKAKLSSLKATTTRNAAALTWGKNSSANYYNIYVLKDGKYVKLAKTTKLTYTASDLNANTSYKFRVTAYNSSNNILAYSYITAKTKAKLSSLKATTTRNAVTLTWGKNSSAKYYNIYVLKDGKYVKLAKTTKLTYTASSLAANTSYKFKVAAFDSSNNILAYSYITAKTKAKLSSLKVTTTRNAAALTWGKNSSAKYYNIYVLKDGKYVKLAKTTNLTYTASNLKANTSYKFRVTAYNSSNNILAYSYITAKTKAKLSSLKATTTRNAVTLTWGKNSSAKYYNIYVLKDGKYVKLAKTTKLTYSASSLAANTSYKFKVAAFDSSNNILAYSYITAKTKAKLSSLKVTTTRNAAALTWGKNSSAKYYNIYVLKDGKYVKLAKTTKLTYTASNLKANTSYKFRVTAYNSSNNILAYSYITAKTK